jgi:O-methyltransferase involved in polyketide biosynthesis
MINLMVKPTEVSTKARRRRFTTAEKIRILREADAVAQAWGGLSCAELYATPDAKRVFDVTNAALGLARIVRRDLPALRYALLHRHTMIDHLLAGSSHRRVVELAAGLSRRGAANCTDRDYTEIDLSPVIARKRALLERTAGGRDVLARLHLVAGDALEAGPGDAAGPPAFVIAEGLAMYLDRAGRRRLFARAAALAGTFVFDLVPADEEPAPGAIGRALEAGMKRFTGGRGFERDARTRAQIVGELREAGFDDVRAIASAEVARPWQLPHADRATTMIVFSASRSTRA